MFPANYPGRQTIKVIAASLLAGLSACADDPASPGILTDVPPGSRPALNVEPLSEFGSASSFDLDVSATGSFKPGHPVHLTFRARAISAVADGELRVTLPEVAAAEQSGWKVVVVPVDEEFRPHIQVRQRFKSGDQTREDVTLVIPEPGYYHVVATGYRHGSDAEPGMLSDVSRRDYWLWIAEHGGRLTTTFDTTLFASDDRKQSGPRGSQRRPSRVRSDGATITCAIYPADGGVTLQSPCPSAPDLPGGTPPPATATFRVLYSKSAQAISYRPVAGARYSWNVVSLSTGATVGAGSGFVAPDGGIGTIDCAGPTDDRRISVSVYTLNDKAIVTYSGGELAYSQVMLCGGHTDLLVQPEMAHLFLNTVKIYDGHRTAFSGQHAIERINVGLYDDARTFYDHRRTDRELHIARDDGMIYGEYGVMVVTHEFGHRFQDTKLFTSPSSDGLMRFQTNCATVHPPEMTQNLGCAFGEAFADWYSVLVRPGDLPTWASDLETNRFYRNCQQGYRLGVYIECTTDGARVQGAVAALLWDITDGQNENHDRIQRAAWVLPDVMRTCRVRVGGNWIAYTGIDHLIFCLENRSPYRVSVTSASTSLPVTLTLFSSRPQEQWPAEASPGAPFPSSNDFRALWLANLYSKLSHVGGNPSLSYEQPAPEPLPPDDGGGGCSGCEIMY